MLKNLFRSLHPRRAARLNEDGLAHWRSGDLIGAERALRAAINAKPGYAPAYGNLGAVLLELHRYGEGVSMLEQAARLNPHHPGVLVNLGNAFYRSGRVTQAIGIYQEALEIDPGNIEALRNLVRPYMEVCDWDALDMHLGRMKEIITPGKETVWPHLISPYDSLFLPFTRQEQLAIAKHAALKWVQAAAGVGHITAAAKKSRNGRLRIGYLSSDFHDHATAHLTLGIYGAHDRNRFEIFAYSIGYPDASVYRQKIANNCDQFVDVHDRGAREIAARIADDGIDILVDLKGYTGGSRPDILALRPASIQVNFLGYPGTMGADFIDYLIADPVIVPESHYADYSERVLCLPGSYQPTDDKQEIDGSALDRVAAGLPTKGFVFCCFNTPAKIDRRSFSCWLKILARTSNSVLWLLQTSREVQFNLARAASAVGLDPARILYAPALPKPRHLARLHLADLVLDTFLCNAHTTATDALWAGVPIVTLTGETFAARVATSLLTAVGLPDLSTQSENDYIELAVDLANNRDRLEQARTRLLANQRKSLFNTSHYVKKLEDAFEEMHAQRTVPPA